MEACYTAQRAQRGTCSDLEGCSARAEGEREGAYAHMGDLFNAQQS